MTVENLRGLFSVNDLWKRAGAVGVGSAVCLSSVGVCFLLCYAEEEETDPLDTVYNYGAYYLNFGIVDYALATANTLAQGDQYAVALLAAQSGLAYMYAHQADPSLLVDNTQARYYSGFAYFGNHLYYGSGSINSDSTVVRFDASSSTAQNSTYAEQYAVQGAYNMSTRAFGNGYTIMYGGSEWMSTDSRYIVGNFNGDPVYFPVVIGETNSLQSSQISLYTSYGETGAQAIFYSGGLDIQNFLTDTIGISGDFGEDLENVHDFFEINYPDLQPELYFYLEDYEPTTDTTETETGTTDSCGFHCTHNIYVDVTVNVDVEGDTFPPEWLDTIATDPTEPNPLEELPTIDIEDYTDILQEPSDIVDNSAGFWWLCFKTWIKDNELLWKYLLGLFTIAVIGAILRGLR